MVSLRLLLALCTFVKVVQGLNLVFVTIDDWRYEREIATPNIDALAENGVSFTDAHANVALCGPSRTSMLSSRKPQTLCYYHHKLTSTHGKDEDDQVMLRLGCTTLPKHLKNNGYEVFGAGKIFHQNGDSKDAFGTNNFLATGSTQCSSGSLFCTVSDESAADWKAMNFGRTKILSAVASGKKFAFFLGIRKPHMPFRVPERFFDNVGGKDDDTYENLPPLENRYRKDNYSLTNFFCSSMLQYTDVANAGATTQLGGATYPLALSLRIRKGYFAAIQWADYVVGEMVRFLENQNLKNDTLIVVTSDNGMLMGEHGNWCKQANYDIGTKVPLLIYDPRTTNKGKRSENRVTSLIDLYPTVSDLLELDSLSCWEGNSRASSVRDVPRVDAPDYAFSTAARCVSYLNNGKRQLSACRSVTALNFIGYSIRTDRWRYTEWRAVTGGSCKQALWDLAPLETELFDHVDSELYKPGSSEVYNITVDDDPYLGLVIEELRDALRAEFEVDTELVLEVSIPEQNPFVQFLFNPTSAPTISPTRGPTLQPTIAPGSPTSSPATTPPPSVKATSSPTGINSTASPSVSPTTARPTPLKTNNEAPSTSGAADDEGSSGLDVGSIAAITSGVVALIVMVGFYFSKGAVEAPIEMWSPLNYR